MPTDYHELRKKYPKWAHRRDEHKKRKRKRKRKRRRSRKKTRKTEKHAGTSTEGMLISLLHQLMLGGTLGPLAKKHGDNVLTGYADKVAPDALAPVRSRAWMRWRSLRGGGVGAGAGAGAAAVVRAPPRSRSPSPRPGGWVPDDLLDWD